MCQPKISGLTVNQNFDEHISNVSKIFVSLRGTINATGFQTKKMADRLADINGSRMKVIYLPRILITSE